MHLLFENDQRWIRGGMASGGGSLTTKNSGFWSIKSTNFRRQRRRKFWNNSSFYEKLVVFCTFGGKFVQILIDIVSLDQFELKNNVISSILQKFENFHKFYGNFGKFFDKNCEYQKYKFRKFSKILFKNAIKQGW